MKMTTIDSRLYFSREDRVGDIYSHDDRVQYKDVAEDYAAVEEVIDHLDLAAGDLYSSVDEYFGALQMPNATPELIKSNRAALVHHWAEAQEALSRLGWVLRIDGNDAFQRIVEAKKNDLLPDMKGL